MAATCRVISLNTSDHRVFLVVVVAVMIFFFSIHLKASLCVDIVPFGFKGPHMFHHSSWSVPAEDVISMSWLLR